jgi:hypothetical protein
MPTPSGQISLNDVNVELGIAGTTTISMNQTNVRTLAGVPSGAISMQNLQNKSNTFSFSFSGGTNLDLRTLAVNAGWNQTMNVEATNTSTIASNSSGTPALTISGSFPNGVKFINSGTIVGQAGNGGPGGAYGVSPAGGYPCNYPGLQLAIPGGTGGTAIAAFVPVQIQNSGSIFGGGGGGGGGSQMGYTGGGHDPSYSGGSGGGGGGGGGASTGGSGGAAGPLTTWFGLPNGRAGGSGGSPGGTVNGGGGGGAGSTGGSTGGPGGPGGNRGNSGSEGGSGSGGSCGNQGSGGAAGNYIAGNSNVTWLATGTRVGNVA